MTAKPKPRSSFNGGLVTNDDLSPWCLECGTPTPAGRERTCCDACAIARISRISGVDDWKASR